jgi:HSP20 family protein
MGNMAVLQDLRGSLREAWESLAEGWRQLSGRAARALTRFTPSRERGEAWPVVGTGWGLLAADVYDEDDHIVVRLEAPGLDKRDFNISVVEDTLLVRGEKRLERETSAGHYQVMECAYGSFERAIPLWAEVEADKARASYKNGVLRVELPKLRASRRRSIEVKAR